MCRVFGFRSVIESQVHTSLVQAENALMHQSGDHPDGWGVAYYVHGAPHIIKSADTAVEDSLFQQVSGVVASETVLAHIRKATVGEHSIINAHPFQFGRWTFAHNGNIRDFANFREEILSRISAPLRRYVLGETDSELLFFLILTHISHRFELSRNDFEMDQLAEAVRGALEEIVLIVGDYSTDDSGPPTDTYFTFVLSNGASMIAHQGGKSLFFSTYKSGCSVSDSCPSFAPECISPTETGNVSHLIFSSEPLDGENVWIPMDPGELIGADWRMRVWFSNKSRLSPSLSSNESLKVIKT